MARPSDGAAPLMIRLPRTIRLDPSDTFVFAHAAEPGEWAGTGSFLVWDTDSASLAGRARAAFPSGFLGVRSPRFSSLSVVSEASERGRHAAIETLPEPVHKQ